MASAETSLPAAGVYPTEIIIGYYDHKFVCNHCQDILKDPMQSFCGHRFCRSCINGVIESGKEIKCAICESEGVEDDYSILQKDQMFPDNAVKRETAKLKVRCVYSNDGCSWTGIFKDIDEHSKLCPKFPLKCDACNKKKIPRDMMPIHEEQECPNQKVTCPVGFGTMERAKSLVHFIENMPAPFSWILYPTGTLRLQMSEGQPERDSRIATLEARVTDIINHSLTTRQAPSDEMTQLIQGQVTQLVNKTQTLDAKISTFEVFVSHTLLERLERYKEEAKQNKEEMQRKIISLERTLAMKDIALTEQDLRIQSLEFASYTGALVWKISDFSQKQQDASKGKSISIYSPAFYTSRLGYKMCARLYPNGDGMGKGTHMSLFFVVMRGHYDALLTWPFKQRVTFMLVNQIGGDHVLDSFRPDPSSSSFSRPTSDMNIASGSPLFISLETVRNPGSGFLKDECMYIKISVDTANLEEPLINDRRVAVES